MDDNVKREIEYLTRLIKQHKQRVYQRPSKSKLVFHNTNVTTKPVIADKCTVKKEQRQLIDLTQETSDNKLPKPSMRVHVNPNFKAHNPVIHINPKIRAKPLIHLNPKVIKDVSCASQKPIEKPQELPQDVKRSVYVNPELMKTLKAKEKCKTDATSPNCLKLKSAKASENAKIPARRLSNSSIIILSKRKLVRVKRSPKSPTVAGIMTPLKIKRLTQSQVVFKKIKGISKEIPVTPKTSKSTLLQSRSGKFEISKYKIDRTTVQKAKAKKNENFQQKTVAKSKNKKLQFVTIGGVVYKSTRNQLIRRSLPSKRKSTANTGNDKFLIAADGKRLQRLKIRRESTSVSGSKILTTVSPKLSSKTIISNKVKQRSIQILWNKMRKNNQPCLLFQKFGFCAGHKKGTCPKLHDKRQVSLCKRFLQGQCLLDNCPLSHDVGPEKMPTCRYFLEGCCTRDSCPYLHVKVSSNTPVCIEFLKGYCAKGNECKLRHENVCPEFDKTGKCGKGKYCPYPHKAQSTGDRRSVKYFKRKRKPARRQENSEKQSEKQEQEGRLRYYEKPEDLGEDLSRKKDSIMRKMEIMKNVHRNSEEKNLPEVEDSESNVIRPPIGNLPAYIPID